jgi:glycosyltransferase involved in cell wall biosynthesis
MNQPLVSIVTVTKDRRRFFPTLVHTIKSQDIGIENVEWIIVDEGRDPIFDQVSDLRFVKYYYQDKFTTLGRKRNFSNALASGEYVAYFDDDNYAFPNRLSASVEALRADPAVEIVGTSEMYVFDRDLNQAYVCGPFGHNHATLGTWCFRRSLLNHTNFDDQANSGEEFAFTWGWSVPIGQIDKSSANMCFEHGGNTVSKRHLREGARDFCDLRDLLRDEVALAFFSAY